MQTLNCQFVKAQTLNPALESMIQWELVSELHKP
jgi:hypothetical protein